MSESPDARVRAAWAANAQPWIRAVRGEHIRSRVLATDAAILEAVRHHSPRTVLDLGCGEGWLARTLASDGCRVVGVDGSEPLIEAARHAGGADFRVLSYEDIAAGALAERFDVVVANFALIGEEPVNALVRSMRSLLEANGRFVVQTLHPCYIGDGAVYANGWRSGSWVGCGEGFSDPAPWYFRTLTGWVELFQSAGLRLVGIREPLDPESGRPASIIFLTG